MTSLFLFVRRAWIAVVYWFAFGVDQLGHAVRLHGNVQFFLCQWYGKRVVRRDA